MAKSNRLGTKLKSALIKRWPSIGRLARSPSSGSHIAVADEDSYFLAADKVGAGELHPVYVGKSRRRYLVGPDVLEHPLFRELAHRSAGESEGMDVACEVVLFEHLLWMLENGDAPMESSMDELVEFYHC
ncbi:auxin-responsive protein SAUR78 [Malania oleifera]|uniref:auxin-responsive protein SAUR78 n=1 Tax=Malania oleifera TaxID=397392 RepID=UPI0025ADD7D5|nr:auxin-responsive protein SAUR78 [Malania oleifera]